MAYMNLRIIDFKEEPDPEVRGAFRTKVIVEEVTPRRLSINLKKADAATIAQLQKLVGKTAMIPCREGFMNGSAFLSLTAEPIIELAPVPPVAPVVLPSTK